MVEKLVMLCAVAMAKDCSETGHLRLRTLLESVLPTSVMSVALSSVHMNHLIQLEEDFPEQFTVIRKQWKELCKKCATKHVPFREKFQRALENPDDGLDYKAFLLNAYFDELMDAATTVRRSANPPRVSSQHILQGALGQSGHNISDEKMLNVLAEHITELTLSSRYILQLRQLIQANDNCMGRLKTLKLDKCTRFTPNIRTPDRTYCVKHILQRSSIETQSIPICCTILKNILRDDATLDLESDVNGSHVSDELSDVGLYDNMVGDKAASEHPGIKELIVLNCLALEHKEERRRAYCSGLEGLYSLERLTVPCSFQNITDQFLHAITKLLKCGSSQLKYLCINGAFLSTKQIKELGQWLNIGNDLKKEVIIINHSLQDSGISTDAEQVFVSGNCSKLLKSTGTIANLTYSDPMLQLLTPASMREYYMPLFTVFLKVYNPEYLNIYCNETDDNCSPLLNHSLQDEPTSSEGANLRKLTVVFNSLYYRHGRMERLHAILCTVNLILKEQSKEVNVHVWLNKFDMYTFYRGKEQSNFDNSLYKTDEIKLFDESDSEDFIAEM